MHGLPSLLIENYLREADFWHVANIGRGCKLDPNSSARSWRGGDLKRTHSVCHTGSVPSL
ncbi:hypothetical protein Gotur_033547 [Gossypium turneri]